MDDSSVEPRIHEHAFKQKERLLAAILLGQVASFLLALTGIASALLASKVCLVLSILHTISAYNLTLVLDALRRNQSTSSWRHMKAGNVGTLVKESLY